MVCENCVKGNRLPGTPTGTTSAIAGFTTYHAPAPSPAEEKKAIVLFTDVFGLALGNAQIMADDFATKLGVDVYLPDMFNGNPAITSDAVVPYENYDIGGKTTLWQKLGFAWLILWAVPRIVWSANFPGQVTARMTKFVEGLKKEKGLEKIGGLGYCYGGLVVVRLAPTGLLSTGVIAHPGPVTKEQVAAINIPTSWITCEEDSEVTPEQALEFEAQFASRTGADKVDYEFKKYMGTKHGFAARPVLERPVVKQAFEDAVEQTVNWFRKTL